MVTSTELPGARHCGNGSPLSWTTSERLAGVLEVEPPDDPPDPSATARCGTPRKTPEMTAASAKGLRQRLVLDSRVLPNEPDNGDKSGRTSSAGFGKHVFTTGLLSSATTSEARGHSPPAFLYHIAYPECKWDSKKTRCRRSREWHEPSPTASQQPFDSRFRGHSAVRVPVKSNSSSMLASGISIKVTRVEKVNFPNTTLLSFSS